MRVSFAAAPRKVRVAVAVLGAAGIMAGAVAVASHDGTASAASAQAAPTVNCPTVQDRLPSIPAASQAEVTRNLALLDTQIAEANKRLVTSQGQGGPNFINNAILGPLKDKRVSTIDRIAISIGRHAAKPAGLDALAACSLNGSGAPATTTASAPAATTTTQAQPTKATTGGGGGGGAVPTVNCPSVQDKLPAIPAGAQAGVTQELANLDREISEANNRLITTQGQGGPNFINNAILGPLKNKRIAVLDRIATDIGRVGTKPTGLDALASCTLN